MLNDKVEFYGRMMSMRAIAIEIGISRETLVKYYNETNNIYEAEKICRKIVEENNNSLVEYNGEMLAIQTIAKKEGIKDAKTLKKYYEQTGNIYEAIKRCKANKIEYNGEMLTINAIATKTGLNGDTLKKYYEQTGNIYTAVSNCLELKKKQEDSLIEYNGERTTMKVIAKKIGIDRHTLKGFYEQTGDIYKAIELYHQRQQEIEDTKLEYKGKKKFLCTIAKDEGVAETTLIRYYKKYSNIDKAVYMAKIQKQRTKKVKMQDTDLGISDLAIILGLKESELLNMLNAGMKIEDIKKQRVKTNRRSSIRHETLRLPNGQPLLDYCVENGLNFTCIYYAINTYGKTIEEAIEEYKKNGQNVPQKWIYEKYGILLRHLLLQNGVESRNIVSYMRKENITFNDAIEEYILRKNAKKSDLDYDWMHELYAVLTDENMTDEYDAFKETFYVSDAEEDCIIQSFDEIETLQRKLLLYEIADSLKEGVFDEQESKELLRVYDVTEKEVETIFFDLYNGFGNKISLSEPQQQRRTIITDIARKWYFLTGDERDKILQNEQITNEEQAIIEELSQNVTKYKNALHICATPNRKGVGLDE